MKIYKRIISIFSAITLANSFLLDGNHFMETITTYASENQIEDLIAVAQKEVGFQGTNNTRNKYTLWCGQLNPSVYPDYGYGYEWCQAFVGYCAAHAGIDKNIIPYNPGTATCKSFFTSRNLWNDSRYHGGSYTPKRGDIIYFQWDGKKGEPSHVGIVTDCDGAIVYTIEGNTGHDQVKAKNYAIESPDIQGYATPKYTSAEKWYHNYNPMNLGDSFYAQIENVGKKVQISNCNLNVQGAEPIGTNNQIWKFERQNDGSYSIISNYDGYSMDVANYIDAPGTNLQMMPYVGNTAQRFFIYSIDGYYFFRPVFAENVLDMNQDSYNLALYPFDASYTSKQFEIHKIDLDGNMPVNIGNSFYAHVENVGKKVQLSSINFNVQGAEPIGTDNQIWKLERQNDGSYSILSYYDGYCMDVSDYKDVPGTNIQMMPYVGNTAQRFFIYSIDGYYFFRPVFAENVLDMDQNSYNLALYPFEASYTSKQFEIYKIDLDGNMPVDLGADFTAQIKCKQDISLLISNVNNNMIGAKPNSSINQVFRFIRQNDGSYGVLSCSNEYSMDVSNYKNAVGTNIHLIPFVANSAQKFFIYSINGAYYFKPLFSDYVLGMNPTNHNIETQEFNTTSITKQFEINKVSVVSINLPGDISQDNQATISDAILLQKWLLAIPDVNLPNWEAGDMNNDGNLTAIDLTLLKRTLSKEQKVQLKNREG